MWHRSARIRLGLRRVIAICFIAIDFRHSSTVYQCRQNSYIYWLSAQWVQCDLRAFNMSVLGKFAVIMADPPWDIHMELPYGTMSDDEMRRLNIPVLQDDGYIFLWVTGRSVLPLPGLLRELNFVLASAVGYL